MREFILFSCRVLAETSVDENVSIGWPAIIALIVVGSIVSLVYFLLFTVNRRHGESEKEESKN